MHFVAIMKMCYIFSELKLEDIFFWRPPTFFILFLVFQLCFLFVSAYLVRNCYTMCACFRVGANTFQVLTRHDSVRACHDSAHAYFFPARTCFDTACAHYDTVRARLNSTRAHLYSARAHLYSTRARLYSALAHLHSVRACLHSARAHLQSTPVPNFQSTSRLRPHLPHRHLHPSNICKRTQNYRPRPMKYRLRTRESRLRQH
jgi:hypothetical protein